MSGLKPCPFCGSEVKIIPEGDCHEIKCDDCQMGMWAYEYEDLERMWNTRGGVLE